VREAGLLADPLERARGVVQVVGDRYLVPQQLLGPAGELEWQLELAVDRVLIVAAGGERIAQ